MRFSSVGNFAKTLIWSGSKLSREAEPLQVVYGMGGILAIVRAIIHGSNLPVVCAVV